VNAPNTTVYGGEKVASQQREAYPGLQPLILNIPAPQAFERALATVHEMRWDVVAADGGSRVDVRSLSRVGRGDAGTNAKRIRAYLDALKAG
jgi:hypothetical protein